MELEQCLSTLRESWRRARDFVTEDGGLATIEWAALGGAALIGAVAIGYVFLNSTRTPANAVGNHMQQCESSAPLNSGATTSCQ